METFDAIIIGCGQAGPPLAARFSGAGQKVALIERKFVGGTCVNAGCTPTKALVASAKAAQVVRLAADYGVTTSAPVIDMAKVAARAKTVSLNSRAGVEGWIGSMPGVELIRGHARFTGPNAVTVNGRALTAPKIFLNTGARPSHPDIPGIDTVPYLTSTDILNLDRVPGHLVVLGGSYIGLEFAQMYRRFGAEVTVIERGERLIGREDPEISDAIRGILEAEGIRILTSTAITGLSPAGGVTVETSGPAGQAKVTGTDLLIAIGRTPNTDDLGLDTAGLTPDPRGFVPVNDRLETAVPGIWALGDCNGKGAFTHTSWNDYEIVAANLFDHADRKVSDRLMGYALYIDPPLGRAGMTETQARAAGHRVRIGMRPMTRVGRAVEKGETQGLMKAVVDADSGKILGAAILGVGGDEAVHGFIDAMNAGSDYKTLQWSVPIHPTVSELIPTLMVELTPG